MANNRSLYLGALSGAIAGFVLGRALLGPERKNGQGPELVWRIMRLVNRGVAGRFDPRGPTGTLVLLLTTTGRKSGLPRVTPLQYEEVDGSIYVASVRGQKADWFRNLVADPEVTVELRGGRYRATAEPITDPVRIADFLELRLARRPGMIQGMLLLHGLTGRPDRVKLEELARQLALVIIRPGRLIAASLS